VTKHPPRGPLCRCGCTWVEHEHHVSHEWETYAGRCLSCPCEEFRLAIEPRRSTP
jgi:hypothetical protein